MKKVKLRPESRPESQGRRTNNRRRAKSAAPGTLVPIVPKATTEAEDLGGEAVGALENNYKFQTADSKGRNATLEYGIYNLKLKKPRGTPWLRKRAGDRGRTGDVQLGKLAAAKRPGFRKVPKLLCFSVVTRLIADRG